MGWCRLEKTFEIIDPALPSLPVNYVLGEETDLVSVHSMSSSRSAKKIQNTTGPNTQPGNSTCDLPPAGFNSLPHLSLDSTIQLVYPGG